MEGGKAVYNKAKEKLNKLFGFGKKKDEVKIDPKKDTILPGDIIQFKNVKMADNKGQTWSFSTHTAIVYKVIGKGVYQVAEQNVNGIRKVKIDDLNYNNLKSGKMIFYRPTK